MNHLRLTALMFLATIVTFSQNIERTEETLPIPNVSISIKKISEIKLKATKDSKKNVSRQILGAGAIGSQKTITDKEGNFSIEIPKGNYLLSLNRKQLTAEKELMKNENTAIKVRDIGYGTKVIITENENFIISQLESKNTSDFMLITVKKASTLRGSLLWDNTVMEKGQETSNINIGLRYTIGVSHSVFCPTGTVIIDGKCMSIEDLEKLPIGKSADYVGHITLLKKIAQQNKTIDKKNNKGKVYDKGTLPGANKH